MGNDLSPIKVTSDYNKFKLVTGNRMVYMSHLNRLKKSIQRKNLLFASPIVVNEKMDIIDGQHRFMAAKELGLPVYYIIVKGLGLADIHTLNTNTRSWTFDDFLNGYVDMGFSEYKRYQKFFREFKLPHGVGIQLCSSPNQKGATQEFKEGSFKMTNEAFATAVGEAVWEFKVFYSGYLKRNFVKALWQMAKNQRFDLKYLLKTIHDRNLRIFDCSTVKEYLRQFEDLYAEGGKKIKLA